MTAGLMRRYLTTTRLRTDSVLKSRTAPLAIYISQSQRTFANVREREHLISESWFSSTPPVWVPESAIKDRTPPDERTLKLGKTIRILHERLPNLLASPLPQEILSPQITLHLFPSTHPHLPTVSGKIAYTAALWTSPVAWGCVPVVGNVKLAILSERMFRNGGSSTAANLRQERLIVKWKTGVKAKERNETGTYRGISAREQVERFKELVSGKAKEDAEFCGLFIFEFDEEGRILAHTIEHTEEGGGHDKTAKVISVTDWLLGRAWGRREEEATQGLALGYCAEQRRAHIRPKKRE